jgi:hypothetical protein
MNTWTIFSFTSLRIAKVLTRPFARFIQLLFSFVFSIFRLLHTYANLNCNRCVEQQQLCIPSRWVSFIACGIAGDDDDDYIIIKQSTATNSVKCMIKRRRRN